VHSKLATEYLGKTHPQPSIPTAVGSYRTPMPVCGATKRDGVYSWHCNRVLNHVGDHAQYNEANIIEYCWQEGLASEQEKSDSFHIDLHGNVISLAPNICGDKAPAINAVCDKNKIHFGPHCDSKVNIDWSQDRDKPFPDVRRLNWERQCISAYYLAGSGTFYCELESQHAGRHKVMSISWTSSEAKQPERCKNCGMLHATDYDNSCCKQHKPFLFKVGDKVRLAGGQSSGTVLDTGCIGSSLPMHEAILVQFPAATTHIKESQLRKI
jgi:hypothetical protein